MDAIEPLVLTDPVYRERPLNAPQRAAARMIRDPRDLPFFWIVLALSLSIVPAAAWLLAQRHRVTVFEADRRPGGHSHTVEVPTAAGPVAVDTGFIVYNEAAYPNLSALFTHLGVRTQASEMSFAV